MQVNSSYGEQDAEHASRNKNFDLIIHQMLLLLLLLAFKNVVGLAFV